VLRFLLWRLLGVLAMLAGFTLVAWCLDGGPGKLLRGTSRQTAAGVIGSAVSAFEGALCHSAHAIWSWVPAAGVAPLRLLAALALALGVLVAVVRLTARSRRRYVRLGVEAYRTDRASAEAVIAMFEVLHKRLLRRWWRRLLVGQPAVSLEVHHTRHRSELNGDRAHPPAPSAWLAITCPQGDEGMVEAALQTAYPNCRVRPGGWLLAAPPVVLRLKKQREFINRVKLLDRFEQDREPPVNRLITLMGACGEPAFVQLAMTPTPAFFERVAKRLYKRHEGRLSRERREHSLVRDRAMVEADNPPALNWPESAPAPRRRYSAGRARSAAPQFFG